MVRITPAWIGKTLVDAKALRARAQLLASNRAMVTALMGNFKDVVYGAAPLGPAHFGYH